MSSASPVGSPPTRRVSCRACSSGRARRHAAGDAGRGGSSPRGPSRRSHGATARTSSTRTWTGADLLVIAPLYGEHPREARGRDRGQRADPGGARAIAARAGRAGDEPRHVGERGAQESVEAAAPTGAELIGPGVPARSPRARAGMGRMSEPEAIFARVRGSCSASPTRSRGRRCSSPPAARGAARLGAVHRQPLVGADGRRARRGGAAARGGGDAARGEPGGAGTCRGRGGRDPDRRRPARARRGPATARTSS